jgi:hypothetical protein
MALYKDQETKLKFNSGREIIIKINQAEKRSARANFIYNVPGIMIREIYGNK